MQEPIRIAIILMSEGESRRQSEGQLTSCFDEGATVILIERRSSASSSCEVFIRPEHREQFGGGNPRIPWEQSKHSGYMRTDLLGSTAVRAIIYFARHFDRPIEIPRRWIYHVDLAELHRTGKILPQGSAVAAGLVAQ